MAFKLCNTVRVVWWLSALLLLSTCIYEVLIRSEVFVCAKLFYPNFVILLSLNRYVPGIAVLLLPNLNAHRNQQKFTLPQKNTIQQVLYHQKR